MKITPRHGFFALLTLLLSVPMFTACTAKDSPATPEAPASKPESTSNAAKPATQRRVREPAVAGLFYPKDPAALSRMIDALLASVPETSVGDLKAIVCPHAGYTYSGPTAAHAYKLLAGRSYSDVIVLAPSHYAWFEGASVLAADVFRTPLGEVPTSPKGKSLVEFKPFRWEPRCRVQRPSWAGQSSRPLPLPGEDTPETWEHSDEVQVPFLQRALTDFKLLTIVLGEVDPAGVARGLAKILDDQTLLVISTDLSHFHPYDQAKTLDARCVQAICNLDLEQMKQQEACGKGPLLALLHLAKEKGWKTKHLDYRNSGDTSGDKSGGVVGYCAIAFYAPTSGSYSQQERQFLMQLAQQTVREIVTRGVLPAAGPDDLPPRLKETKGCFVTLTKRGQLRGCIGHILPQAPLYQAVIDNARNAAIRDHRFPPVQPNELDELEFEISVLTKPLPLEFSSPDDLLAKLHPHQDGVVLHLGERSSTFLPQVWEQLPDKVQFLNHLARKAGSAESDWRLPSTRVSIYHVESFRQSEL